MELRECPYCGGEAEVRELCSLEYEGSHYVMCSLCATQSTLYATEEAAAIAWNRRHSDKELDRLRERVAELEAAIDDAINDHDVMHAMHKLDEVL